MRGRLDAGLAFIKGVIINCAGGLHRTSERQNAAAVCAQCAVHAPVYAPRDERGLYQTPGCLRVSG